MCEITIFTPVYNRAYCLKKLYDSLKEQTWKDFEWVIVNDGSTCLLYTSSGYLEYIKVYGNI